MVQFGILGGAIRIALREHVRIEAGGGGHGQHAARVALENNHGSNKSFDRLLGLCLQVAIDGQEDRVGGLRRAFADFCDGRAGSRVDHIQGAAMLAGQIFLRPEFDSIRANPFTALVALAPVFIQVFRRDGKSIAHYMRGGALLKIITGVIGSPFQAAGSDGADPFRFVGRGHAEWNGVLRRGVEDLLCQELRAVAA